MMHAVAREQRGFERHTFIPTAKAEAWRAQPNGITLPGTIGPKEAKKNKKKSQFSLVKKTPFVKAMTDGRAPTRESTSVPLF